MDLSLITTKDGSHTLFIPRMGEYYHSHYGAISESRHIFIECGFNVLKDKKDSISIFEAGFGTGLNTLLTFIESKKSRLEIYYTAIELYPLKKEIWQKLNYCHFLGENDFFSRIHMCKWNKQIECSSGFFLHKIQVDLTNTQLPENNFDIVYFDAFAPSYQPELWEKEIFNMIINSLKPGGLLTTYSSKGSVKRVLKECGFEVFKLPGPEGKREIIRARKP